MDKSETKINKLTKKPFFRHDPLTTVLLAIAIFFGSQFLAVVLVSTVPAFRGWSEEQSVEWFQNSTSAQFIIMSLVAAFSITFIFYLLKKARILPARIGWVKPRIRDFGYAGAAYVLYFISYFVVLIMASVLIPSLNTDQAQNIGFDNLQGNAGLIMAFISLVILPPLWEETLFRGFLFSSFRAKYRLRWSILFTSLIFGIAHLEIGNGTPLVWVAAIDTLVLSCFLCYLREKTGSLWAPMILHAGKNMVAFYFLFLS